MRASVDSTASGWAGARHASAVVAGAALLLAGCGGPVTDVVEVSGRVTYQGKPVTTGTISFVPASSEDGLRPGTSPIAEDGRYSIRAFGDREGLQAGKYRVTVQAYTGSFIDVNVRYVVPERFARVETSGLTATVPDGEPVTVNFALPAE